jgi:hypothetical protein
VKLGHDHLLTLKEAASMGVRFSNENGSLLSCKRFTFELQITPAALRLTLDFFHGIIPAAWR